MLLMLLDANGHGDMASPSTQRRSNLKILIVSKTRSGGGTEKHIADIVPELCERGLGVEVAYLEDGLWPLVRRIRIGRFSHVHFFLPRSYLLGSLASSFTQATRIMSRRSLRSCYQTPLIRWVEERLHRRTRILVGNSPAVVEELREEAPNADIRLIRNAVKTKPLPREKNPTFFIVCVANAWPYKGLDDLMAAVRMVNLPEPWHCILIGRGTEKLSNWGNWPHVKGLGWRTDVRSWLGLAGVFVLPTHGEGSSNALLEAMAAGVPCIATDVGGNADAIQHGVTGVLVPPRRPDMLAAQIKAAALCREQFAEMARKAQIDIAMRFSFDRMIDEYEALYRDAVA